MTQPVITLRVNQPDRTAFAGYVGGGPKPAGYTLLVPPGASGVPYFQNQTGSVKIFVFRRDSDGAIIVTATATNFADAQSTANNFMLGSPSLYGAAAQSAAQFALSQSGGKNIYFEGWSQGAAIVINTALTLNTLSGADWSKVFIEVTNSAPQVLFPGFDGSVLNGHQLNIRNVMDEPIDPDTGRRPGDIVSLAAPTYGQSIDVIVKPTAHTLADFHWPGQIPDNPADWRYDDVTNIANNLPTLPILLDVEAAAQAAFNPATDNKAAATGRLLRGMGEAMFYISLHPDADGALPRLHLMMISIDKMVKADPLLNFAFGKATSDILGLEQ